MCVHACPLKIIALDKTRLNAKGYHPAKLVEPDKCVGCASCATMCLIRQLLWNGKEFCPGFPGEPSRKE